MTDKTPKKKSENAKNLYEFFSKEFKNSKLRGKPRTREKTAMYYH